MLEKYNSLSKSVEMLTVLLLRNRFRLGASVIAGEMKDHIPTPSYVCGSAHDLNDVVMNEGSLS